MLEVSYQRLRGRSRQQNLCTRLKATWEIGGILNLTKTLIRLQTQEQLGWGPVQEEPLMENLLEVGNFAPRRHFQHNILVASEPGNNNCIWLNYVHSDCDNISKKQFSGFYQKKLGKPAKDWNILVGVGKRFLLVRVRQHHLDIIYGDYDPKWHGLKLAAKSVED